MCKKEKGKKETLKKIYKNGKKKLKKRGQKNSPHKDVDQTTHSSVIAPLVIVHSVTLIIHIETTH